MNIGKDFSVRVNFGEKEFLVNRCFDHVHLWRELGFSILKIVDPNDGFVQMCLTIEDAEQIDEQSIIDEESGH